jgi:hypothetical protein
MSARSILRCQLWILVATSLSAGWCLEGVVRGLRIGTRLHVAEYAWWALWFSGCSIFLVWDLLKAIRTEEQETSE